VGKNGGGSSAKDTGRRVCLNQLVPVNASQPKEKNLKARHIRGKIETGRDAKSICGQDFQWDGKGAKGIWSGMVWTREID